MYQAELKGKLSSSTERMEDILTSNVFSFFKYSDRTVYLKKLLKKIDIGTSNRELEEADFLFWPNFEDGTEPDVVVIVGKYYLIFEAKLYSDFGQETETIKAQLIREVEGGLKVAKSLKKELFLVAITEDYFRRKDFKEIKKYQKYFKWINWQSISEILLILLEKHDNKLPNYLFALDLYKLLDKKKLRLFRPFKEIRYEPVKYFYESIFLPVGTTEYVDDFVGFKNLLSGFKNIETLKENIFYNRDYFKDFDDINIKVSNNIFYRSEEK